MNKRAIGDEVIGDTGFSYTTSLISGKYKMSVLYCLAQYRVVRYNELKRYLGKITFKTLTDTLKSMEGDGLILRKEYPQIPPKVEYSLTQKGETFIPILKEMCRWGDNYRK